MTSFLIQLSHWDQISMGYDFSTALNRSGNFCGWHKYTRQTRMYMCMYTHEYNTYQRCLTLFRNLAEWSGARHALGVPVSWQAWGLGGREVGTGRGDIAGPEWWVNCRTLASKTNWARDGTERSSNLKLCSWSCLFGFYLRGVTFTLNDFPFLIQVLMLIYLCICMCRGMHVSQRMCEGQRTT